MRRKPSSQGGSGGYNNQSRKPRYQGGGGGEFRSQGQNNNSGQHGRPRKNYSALREKYLAQARDALASGDRVLAENYYQHADHCYRMMVEEGYNNRNNYTPPPAVAEAGSEQAANQNTGNEQAGDTGQQHNAQEEVVEDTISQLPAFLTASFIDPDAAKPVEQVQNWEEN